MCKVFEHILCTHIRSHFDRHGILTDLNHGFRSKHSCESQLLITTHDFLSRLDLRHEVDVLVLDFSKAFDTVPHERLLQKLELYGLHGDLHNWIRSFLTSRSQSVMIDGCHSQEDRVLSGVPQGTVLGPLLFLCHINDLPSVVDPNTAVRLFADDCLLYRSITSPSDQFQLQRDLAALSHWGDCWGMRFNVKKCNVLHLGKTSNSDVRFYELNNTVLSEVSQAKYLGVLISNDMSWSPHIASVVHKSHQRLGFVRRNLRGAPFKYRDTAYQSLVQSQLEYSSSVWDPTLIGEINNIEMVQRRAARWARGKYGVVSVTALLKDLGWAELADRRQNQRLTLFYKILHNLIAVPPDSVSITPARRSARLSKNQDKLQQPRASYKASPLWRSTVFRTVPQWNALPASVAEADSLQVFRSRLAAHKP